MKSLRVMFFCVTVLFIVSCMKTDSTPRFDGDFVITADLLHFPQSTMYVDGDTSSNDLALATNGSHSQKWKIAGVNHQNFSILASDFPGYGLHFDGQSSPRLEKVPASTDQSYLFNITQTEHNSYAIQSVATGQYLYVPTCEKMLMNSWVIWAYDVNFTSDITQCSANYSTADTCYCVFSFHLVKQ